MTKSFPRLLPLLLIGIAILITVFFIPKLSKPKEPSFSLKLPDGWYRDLGVRGYPAHLLEYNTLLKEDSRLIIHNTDIFTVKDGYFINISAYTYEWAWPEFVDSIEKSFNTISFNPK